MTLFQLLSEPLIPMSTLITLIFFKSWKSEKSDESVVRTVEKHKNAARSPYATENDRRMNLKGISRILRNFGRGSACLLEKCLILLIKSSFF